MKEPWTPHQNKKVLDWKKVKKIPDMHSHSIWSNHAKNTLEDITNHNSNKRLWVALNEHLPMPKGFINGKEKYSAIFDIPGLGEGYKKSFTEINAMQVEQIKPFARDAKGIDLPIGIEVAINTGFEEETDELILMTEDALKKQGVKLNHLSAGIHSLDGYDLFKIPLVKEYLKHRSPEYLLKRYFDVLGLATESGKYDFICHPGMIHFFYNNATKLSMMNNKSLREVYEIGFNLLFDSAKRYNVGIEINTSGIDRPSSKFDRSDINEDYYVECIHPHMPLFVIREAIRRGIILTAGSDWHNPGAEQRYFDQLHDVLLKNGAKQIYKIADRKPVAILLR
jgi:HisJ family histidinol phosphate phosphatase